MALQLPIIASPGLPSESLWQNALNTLDDSLKADLHFDTSSKHDVVAAALIIAHDKRKLCLQKRWKFQISDERPSIVIRKVMDKIVGWLEKFMSIGDVAVQYDPVHASLPWTSVRFISQVSNVR